MGSSGSSSGASRGGAAMAASDYTATSGSLDSAAGDAASKGFSVPTSNALPYSDTRTFALALSAPNNGATLGSPSQATGSITGSGRPMGQAAAARLLMQGSFGATILTIAAAAARSYDAWFAQQSNARTSLVLPSVPDKDTDWTAYWLRNACLGPDQLRQRMAFALSEIFVVSNNGGPLQFENQALAAYYDLLANNALGNFRTLLEKVTLSPAMGLYLSMFRNDKPNPATGVHADENYAREIMQLFTVGLVKLDSDGTVQTDSSGRPIATYGQADVENLARVFTGWASKPTSHTGEDAWLYDIDYIDPMVAYANHHDTAVKTIIGGVAVPAGGTAAGDLKLALDTLFDHPNVGPFIARQLIERLVTSNPTPAYVGRVAAAFNNNGQGVRGDLLAVAKAILTDPEATSAGGNRYGKLREPLLRLTGLWRAFNARNADGGLDEYLVLLNGLAEFGEYPLRSPSVFNFFRPDYERAGPLTDAGLVVPEFQITNENSLVLTENRLQMEAYQFIDSRGASHAGPDYDLSGSLSSSSVMLRTAQWERYAFDAASLVDQMNLVLMAGQMPAAMRSSLVSYAAAIPRSESAYAAKRVAETADLIVNSPQYAVQR
jgi:uncharacterized protein (DUF1800 family)